MGAWSGLGMNIYKYNDTESNFKAAIQECLNYGVNKIRIHFPDYQGGDTGIN